MFGLLFGAVFWQCCPKPRIGDLVQESALVRISLHWSALVRISLHWSALVRISLHLSALVCICLH